MLDADDYCPECGAGWKAHDEDGACPEDVSELVGHLSSVEDCAIFREVLMEWAVQVEGKPGFEYWPLVVQKLAAAVDARERALFEVAP